MSIEEMIRKIAFGQHGRPAFQTVVAKITKVKGDMCDVEDVMTGCELKNVRLNAAVGCKKGVVITPSIDSDVLVTMISSVDSFISMYSQIDKLEYKDDHGCEVVIEGGKVSVKNKETELWSELSNLLKALQQAVIATPAGSGAFDAATVKKFTDVETKLSKLLC